jgi:hypothetical protein
MLEKGARATLALCSLVIAACGAKTLDFSGDTPPPTYLTTSFRKTAPDKVDLLFMIDNSSSMADKQSILATAVPDLVDRLINPRCVDPITGRPVGNAVDGVCPVGELAFKPVNDIHIGIISSSLGDHGAGNGVCDDAADASAGRSDPHNNDRAHLLTRVADGTPVPIFEGKGFLYYNPTHPGALGTSADVATPFKSLVAGVGQHGCGYEASLEAVYRFLVDPEPYDNIRLDGSGGGFAQAILQGTDQELLKQRADFLRPDSLVSVVLVTDENDCSVIDGSQGFYALLPPSPTTGRSILRPGTSMCKTNPNDVCCFNCAVTNTPSVDGGGCPYPLSDPACQKGELAVVDDQPNLRCFNQKQRYGADFLYPVDRYIDAFSKALVPNRRGELVDNPLFSCASGVGCKKRDRSLVFVTGIVGVPWQDLAVDRADLGHAGYKTAPQLRDDGIWADIVGDPLNPAGPVPPRDSHMIESITPRPGLPGPESGPRADPVHGHEWDPTRDSTQPNADLQYACIFDLAPAKKCTGPEDCDCFGTQSELDLVHKPLCQNAQGDYTNEQTRGKAYPGTRILQVLQGLGDQGTATSICPVQLSDPSGGDYGFTPAVVAIVGRLRRTLLGSCMTDGLAMNANGQTACSIIEVHNDPACSCNIEPGRIAAPPELITPEMRSKGSCFCEILQLKDAALGVCKTTLSSDDGNGWCYVDPAQDSGASCDVVSSCPAEQKRMIHFINTNSEPRAGATTFLRCDTPPLDSTTPACR